MTRLLRNLPIKHKLTLLTVMISGVALLIACAAFAIYEYRNTRQTMARDFAIITDIFGENVASGLAFNDATSITQTLGTLAKDRRILAAAVFDKAGAPVATYQRADVPGAFKFPADGRSEQHYIDSRLDTWREVSWQGEPLGRICVSADLAELHTLVWRFVWIVAALLVVCSWVALLLASRLQRIISDPIMALAATAGAVAVGRDYAVRAVRQGDDEVGRLVDGFNNMLAQIQARDTELQAARTHLEQRVGERTAALRQAQAQVLRDQARFKLIFEGVPVGISYYAGDDVGQAKVGLINDAHLRICGVDREQAADQAIFKRMTHPDDVRRQLLFEERLDRGEIDRYSMEKRYLRSDGRTVWVVFTAQLMRSGEGEFERLSTVVDITDLKQAQEAALTEQARFKLIFESMPVGISYFLEQAPGAYATSLINDAHLQICGLTREQAQDLDRFKRLTHPEDRVRQMMLERQLDAGEIDRFAMEKRYVRPDGETVWVAFSTLRQPTADGGIEHLSTIVDITALKRAQEETARQEAQLRFILEAVPFSVAWVRYHDTGNESMLNRAFYRITGLSQEQAVDVDVVRSISHPEDLKKQDALRAKIDRGDIDDFVMEKRYVRPDGTLTWVNLTITVYRGPDRRIQQEVSTLVDITERKQAEVELEQLHRQLLTTSRQAGMAEVATGVLHNVGNVLNSVNVSSTLVAEQVRHSKVPNLGKLNALLDQHAADLGAYLTADPKGKMIPAYLATLATSLAAEQHMMLTELGSLQKNIEHIKDIVAMQQSYAKTSGVTETVSVPDLVEDALRMNSGSLARHDIDLVRQYQARPVVTLDKHKVLQILVNLVRNAKYACDESGRVDKLITLRITADNRFVSIDVMDNGVGIAPENLTRIFAHGFTTRLHGHGFGLHSGALAATELGGSLIAHSTGLGHGATFTLKLPYKTEVRTHAKSPA